MLLRIPVGTPKKWVPLEKCERLSFLSHGPALHTCFTEKETSLSAQWCADAVGSKQTNFMHWDHFFPQPDFNIHLEPQIPVQQTGRSKNKNKRQNVARAARLLYSPFCFRFRSLNLLFWTAISRHWRDIEIFILIGGDCSLPETRQPLTDTVSAAQPCNPIFWVIVSLGTSQGVRFYSSQSPLWSTLPLVLIYCRSSLWVRWNNFTRWGVSPRRGLGCFQMCIKRSGKDSPFVSNTDWALTRYRTPAPDSSFPLVLSLYLILFWKNPEMIFVNTF